MNILVTGGAGYLGSILVPELLMAGHNVAVIDNFIYQQAGLNHVCGNPNFDITKGDVRVESTMRALISKVDVIIPLAALVGAPICNADPVGAQTINHDSILMMMRLITKSQIVIMPTTNSAYGSGEKNNFCTEESPLNPLSKYAIDKVAVEKVLMQHPNAVSLRLATVFGMSPRMRIDLLVNDFTYRAVSDRFIVLFESSFKRNYIHVRDVTRAFMHAIENIDAMKGNIYNVGLSTANISKKELCDVIRNHVPEFVSLDAGVGSDPDQRNYIVSNEKLESTGFRTIYDLDYGVVELIKGYKMIKNSRYGNV
jgi:nucleoside-diphosphate-sugar epimerase